jgi:Zn-finger nucleic acid-binding protein
VELYIEMTEQAEGVDLLICKECWGVGVAAKSMESVISKGGILDGDKDNLIKRTGVCKCPMCSTKMDVIELDLPENVEEKLKIVNKSSKMTALSTKKVVIDSCSNCPTFWFDAGELDLLNGIQPKMRDVNYDSESNRLIEDQSLTEDFLKKKDMNRKAIGGFVVIISLASAGSMGTIGKVVMGLIGLGGFIAILSKNPKQNLAVGTCDKCLEENKSLAWNCQRGGCWAHICNDCQTIGDDPVEAYAKTLGKVAVGTVMVGIGILAVAAIAESGGGGLGIHDLVGGSGGSKGKEKISDWKGMLLCRECVEVAKEEEQRQLEKAENRVKKLKKAKNSYEDEASTNIEEVEKERKNDYEKIETVELRRSSSCDYVDALNGKKCKRVTFRHLNYCYMHK